jgi:hypothetical protein
MIKTHTRTVPGHSRRTSEYGGVVPRYPRSYQTRTYPDTVGENIHIILVHTRTCPNIYLPVIISILGHFTREYEYVSLLLSAEPERSEMTKRRQKHVHRRRKAFRRRTEPGERGSFSINRLKRDLGADAEAQSAADGAVDLEHEPATEADDDGP